MKTLDFEKAIEALGVNGLELLKFVYQAGTGQVGAVYGRMGDLVFLMWDAMGRGFRFEANPNLEGCVYHQHPEYLDYRRDSDFDLKFE